MASEERLRELEDKYEGYAVYDNRGEKIGKVDDLFIDETDREEYIGVKMGFLGRKSTLIPMDIVRVNEADKAVEVSESKDHVKNAPSFDDDEDITSEYEDRIRSHFELESPTDTARGRGSYGAYSGAGDEEQEGERDYPDQVERTDRETSKVDTEYGERTGSFSGTAAGGASGSAEVFGGEESMGDEGPSGSPVSRQTEETETFEEGGRTKVRRRVIREEIVEEGQDS
ncbi:MAG: PRC-barrel domain-containing protein [Actinomycetota bacterium]|nr:PRC-barrel domain-containing protein [Actinomycetota bacterium]